MVTILIASAERRARNSYQLTDVTGRCKYGTMAFNQSKGRHEMEVTEEKFLEISKNIALAGRLAGNCVYVAEIRHNKAEKQPVISEAADPAPKPAPKTEKKAAVMTF